MTINSVPKPIKKIKKKPKRKSVLLKDVIAFQRGERKFTKSEEKKAIARLQKACKDICSEICKLLWKGKCAVCGKEGTSAHHFFSWKACSNVRFNLDNLLWVCYYDHIGKIHQQGLTEPAREKIIERIGLERFNTLYYLAFQEHHYSIDGLTDILREKEFYLQTLKENLAKGYEI